MRDPSSEGKKGKILLYCGPLGEVFNGKNLIPKDWETNLFHEFHTVAEGRRGGGLSIGKRLLLDHQLSRAEKTVFISMALCLNIGVPGADYGRGGGGTSFFRNVKWHDQDQQKRHFLHQEGFAKSQNRRALWQGSLEG